MNEEIEEYYEELYRLYIDENQPLERRYRQLRESLERVVREKIQGNSLQTTDLAARINYVATQYGLDLKEQNQLHTFRLTSNDILNHRKSPVKEEFLCDLRAGYSIEVVLSSSQAGNSIFREKRKDGIHPPHPCML